MSERVILKLGGSVITDKSADCAINREQTRSDCLRRLPVHERAESLSSTVPDPAGIPRQSATTLIRGQRPGRPKGSSSPTG